jgi:hypothetical protein
LIAERLVEVLQAAEIDAFSRPGGAASSAAFAQTQAAFWDLLVPSESFGQSEKLIREELAAVEHDAAANAQAAEDEALSGETPVEP